MGAALQRMFSSFYTRQLEVVLVGLENSGKTTLMNGKEGVRRCVAGVRSVGRSVGQSVLYRVAMRYLFIRFVFVL